MTASSGDGNAVVDHQNLSLELEQERRNVSFDTYDYGVRQLLDMIAENAIDIAPAYQRKFVWDAERQSEFIESVFLGIPIPSLFMATNKDSTWEVVDGVQRLSTLVHFSASEDVRLKLLKAPNALTLTGIEKLKAFNGKKFIELLKSIQLQFLTRPIRVTTLNDKSDLTVRFDLFERLNSGGVKLEEQEIRNCVYQGPFNDALKQLSKNSDFKKVVRLSRDDITNGTTEEYVLRFFAFLERYGSFGHSVRDFLNSYMADLRIQVPSNALQELFSRTFSFIAGELSDGIIRGGRKATPVNLYEAIAIGTALVIQGGAAPKIGVLKPLLDNDELRELTSGGTNSRKRVVERIEFVRDRLL